MILLVTIAAGKRESTIERQLENLLMFKGQLIYGCPTDVAFITNILLGV